MPMPFDLDLKNFDTAFYLSSYPDLQEACRYMSESDKHAFLVAHFYNNGYSEGRKYRLRSGDHGCKKCKKSKHHDHDHSDSDSDSDC